MSPVYFILFDGTDAVASTKTNISEIRDIFQAETQDNVKYIAGTNTRAASTLTKKIQRLASTEVHRDVSEAIAWMEGKEDGELFVFGYSRGAIAARYFAQCMTNKKFVAQYEIDPPGKIRPVEFLGLFDPVYGPFNFLAAAPRHETDVVHNSRVKTYAEVNALNEHRFIMRLRSGKKSYYKWLKDRTTIETKNFNNWGKTISDINAPTYYRDREKSGVKIVTNPLGNTGRHFEFMPGGHADVGGQNGCEVIASKSLLTILLTALEASENLKKVIPNGHLDDLIHFTDAAGEPTPNKSLSGVGRFSRTLKGFGWEYFRRSSIQKM